MADDDEPEDDGQDDGLVQLHPGARVGRGLPRLVHDQGGRIPAFIPSPRHRDTVTLMAANRTPLTTIAQALGVAPSTVTKHFKKELRYGCDLTIARVGVQVLRKALRGNMTAARYWLMTHGGAEWKLSKSDAGLDAAAFGTPPRDKEKKVRFYIPRNNRDRPEAEPEGPLIEGEATGTDDG